jgi:hypothetical protein
MTERITRWVDVRCASESGRRADIGGCRKCAKTGLEQVQQITGADAQLFNHLVGAQQERLGDC